MEAYKDFLAIYASKMKERFLKEANRSQWVLKLTKYTKDVLL